MSQETRRELFIPYPSNSRAQQEEERSFSFLAKTQQRKAMDSLFTVAIPTSFLVCTILVPWQGLNQILGSKNVGLNHWTAREFQNNMFPSLVRIIIPFHLTSPCVNACWRCSVGEIDLSITTLAPTKIFKIFVEV